MINKLRSHLRVDKGFTLIELLVVIAIIAILVLLVVIAINPAERLREAADRRASGNVRSAGTLIATCVTRQLAATPPGSEDDCDTAPEVEAAAGGDGNVPTAVTIADGATATNVCAIQAGRPGVFWRYQQLEGQVDNTATGLADCP